MEIRLRQQGLHEAHQRRDKGRVGRASALPLQPRDPEPRRAGAIQVAEERHRHLGQQEHLALRDVRLRGSKGRRPCMFSRRSALPGFSEYGEERGFEIGRGMKTMPLYSRLSCRIFPVCI